MKSLISAAAMSLALAAGGASAATFSGKFYDVGGYGQFLNPLTITGSPLADSNAAVLGFLAGNPTPDATFTTAAIGYGRQNISTLANFLGAGSVIEGDGATSFLGSILTFTGKIKLAPGINEFVVFSDDGFLLYIDNVLAGFYDGLRPPRPSDFVVEGGDTGGIVDFSLIYYEGSQIEAALDVSLNGKILAPVPLPAGGLLLLGALGGIAALRRRKTA